MHWTKVIGILLIGPNQVGGYSYTSSPQDEQVRSYACTQLSLCTLQGSKAESFTGPACFEIVWLAIFTHSLPVVDYACGVRVLENRG